MGQIGLTVSITMAVLFTLAVLGFAINFAVDNSSPVDISDDSLVSGLYSNTASGLSQMEEDSNSTYTSISKSTVETGSSTFKSAGSLGITFSNLLPTFYNVLRVGYYKIFGTDSGFGIFLTTFISLLGIISVLYIVKTLIGGSPD
jgi:hypothetical protein